MEYYISAFRKYAMFTGRARRAEYCYFLLFNFLVSFVLGFISGLISDGLVFLGAAYFLIAIIPTLAVSVRRLHDIGKSGWFLLLMFIPLINIILVVLILAKDGDIGDNKYGSNPKVSISIDRQSV